MINGMREIRRSHSNPDTSFSPGSAVPSRNCAETFAPAESLSWSNVRHTLRSRRSTHPAVELLAFQESAAEGFLVARTAVWPLFNFSIRRPSRNWLPHPMREVVRGLPRCHPLKRVEHEYLAAQ
jgi:hypothetical protein